MEGFGRAMMVPALLVLCAAFPAAAAAAAPTVTNDDVSFTDGSTATVSATVDPQSESTMYFAEYGPQGSLWCQSGGASGTPAGSTAPQALGPSDSGWYPVQVGVTGLTPGASLCAVLVAQNSSGSGQGSAVDFTFTPSAPMVSLGPATLIAASTEQLEGSVGPGGTATTYRFAWDDQGSAWCATGGSAGAPANSTADRRTSDGVVSLNVFATLTGLTRGVTYCWQLTATNAQGSSSTAHASFRFGLPVATTWTATFSPDRPTDYAFGGALKSLDSIVSYRFDWAPSASPWCQSNGSDGSPTGSTQDRSTGSVSPDGSWIILMYGGGLSPGTAYCFRIVGTNDVGSGFGDTVPFITPPPAGLTVSVSGTGSGTVQAPGLQCQGGCSHAYFSGARVPLRARADAGSRFSGWRGACSGTGACAVTMTQARLVTAMFTAPPRCSLTRPPIMHARHRLTVSIRCNQNAQLQITGVVTRRGPSPSTHQRVPTRYRIRPLARTVPSTRRRSLTVSLPVKAFQKPTPFVTESVQLTIVASNANGSTTMREQLRLPG
jgi:List-Bact-rpt repeat protein